MAIQNRRHHRCACRSDSIVHRVIEARNLDEENDPSRWTFRDARYRPSPKTALDFAVQDQLLLTKGDNNGMDNVVLYARLERLQRKHVIGKVRGFLPYVGYASVSINDMPRLTYAIFGVIGLIQ
ncbi:hypothetical protein BDZ97DRAFT_1165480 [Flammula alnicola]|nr:hypothetical protein BDZ97DRAFT_1165480 [Flammula alnicola]